MCNALLLIPLYSPWSLSNSIQSQIDKLKKINNLLQKISSKKLCMGNENSSILQISCLLQESLLGNTPGGPVCSSIAVHIEGLQLFCARVSLSHRSFYLNKFHLISHRRPQGVHDHGCEIIIF